MREAKIHRHRFARTERGGGGGGNGELLVFKVQPTTRGCRWVGGGGGGGEGGVGVEEREKERERERRTGDGGW